MLCLSVCLCMCLNVSVYSFGLNLLLCVCSEYPSHRSIKDSDGASQGVAGTLSLLQNVTMSTQPICGFDWNADKLGLCVCTAFDQTLRVLIVTKLKTI